MLRNILIYLGSALVIAVPIASAAPQDGPTEWIGGYTLDSNWTQLRMHMVSSKTGLKVTIDVPAMGLMAQPVTDIRQQLSKISFRLAVGPMELDFDGRIGADMIAGAVASGEHHGRFELMRSSAVARTSLVQYQGAYQWDQNHFVYVRFWNELGEDQLGAFDESGQVRSLYPTGGDKFFVGAGLAFPVPLEARVTFNRNRRSVIASLSWQPTDAQPRTARFVQVDRQEEISFSNGETRLSGTLMVPVAKGPHPAVVVLHGSGPQDRNGSLPFVEFLIRHGIAILVFDKRGVGKSTGDWKQSSFQDLADDAVAAVHFLQTKPDVDPKQIGVFGVSQGGWIGPLAASRSQDVAFVISISGPGITPAEETLDFIRNEMREDGLSSEDVREAVELTKIGFDYARTGTNWEGYLAARRRSENKPWFPFMDLPSEKDAWVWKSRRLTNDYDPLKALEKVRCPVLGFFGGLDLNVVANKNIEKWNDALKAGGNQDYTLLILGKGNHILMQSKTGSIFEFPQLKTFILDYRRILQRWVCQRLQSVNCRED